MRPQPIILITRADCCSPLVELLIRALSRAAALLRALSPIESDICCPTIGRHGKAYNLSAHQHFSQTIVQNLVGRSYPILVTLPIRFGPVTRYSCPSQSHRTTSNTSSVMPTPTGPCFPRPIWRFPNLNP